MSDPYFDKVYKARTDEETRDLYDAWAKTYDAAVEGEGYATPRRCAEALHAFMPDTTAPILDFGCGTGLSGLALRLAGFTTIDGVDLSPGMLELARERQTYRNLSRIGTDDPLPEGYAAIAAIGVIGAGAAPLNALERIFDALDAGAMCVFSFNDHTLEDPEFEALVDRRIADGSLTRLFREHGPHLPGKEIGSTVYIVEKK
ncbi:class I SAM-dependent DNA methyltransferase [Mameliella alba]|uniref:class I SAM-dependent DNA methyltransferase n=1 Tax=Mameliella alba TaxID=561184 RepID=UPI000B534DCC|nr:methyltransferase domain-containing protein [Mameliella alba]MBY6119166.1 class I SAM-dependent methyltransferase [Mameliella alba]OWV45174.1 methyltransferase type 11 [Mameliella alba]OWV66825.1 methyltransferase type 11 [Mameliella alba]BBU56574.1 SAM-dependent methyltransferase [Mameliella alba]